MKMKSKKIYKVDKTICTAEQRIAYHYAFSWNEALKKIYSKDFNLTAIQKSEALQEIIDNVVRSIKEKEIDKRYNIDLIIHCFRNGAEKYANGYSILSSYEEVGRIFYSLYEIV